MEEGKNKLRPIVYTTSYFKRGHQNTAQQMFLLSALKVTQDPKKLREMIGVKTVAEVYRTLDKLVMRKEYHKALADAGVSFNYIVEGIKGVAETGDKDTDRLKAYQILLKSLGMDKYEGESVGASGTWEEELIKSIEAGKNEEGNTKLSIPLKYKVTPPVMPEAERKAQEDEEDVTSSLYETK